MKGAAQSNINSFIKYKKDFAFIDSIVESGNYKLAKSLLLKIDKNKIPKDFISSYYTAFCEIYLNFGDLEKTCEFAKKSILSGCDERYLKYLKGVYDTSSFEYHTIFKQFEVIYPEMLASYRGKLNQKLILEVNKMYNDDQSIRHTIIQALKNKNKKESDSISAVLEKTDSINQLVYEDIVGRIGWVYRDSIGYELKNYHIILAHGSSEKRLKYVDIGYKLAVQNKVPWIELIDIESFDFIKTEKKIGNISFLGNFIVKNLRSSKSDFNKFLAYCIKYDLSDGGTFNGREKKMKLYINIHKDKTDLNAVNKLLLSVKKNIVDFGLDPSKIVIDINNAVKSEKSVNDYCIGIEYL